jgi:hypothetical protein
MYTEGAMEVVSGSFVVSFNVVRPSRNLLVQTSDSDIPGIRCWVRPVAAPKLLEMV